MGRIKINESQLRKMIRESINELDWKTYANAAKKRYEQPGKGINAWELSQMAKDRFNEYFNDNYRYNTLGDKLRGKQSKTFDSDFSNIRKGPELRGKNEKGEELRKLHGNYYNMRRGVTTPEKFFKDKEMSDTFNRAAKELDDYNKGNYDYTPEKGWHLKESKLTKMIKESIKKALNENIYVGSGGGYYGGSSIFTVETDETGNPINYSFSPSGWDFDTKSQLEAAAICASVNGNFLSQLVNCQELQQLPVAPASDNDKIEALYWLTGGNVEWNHGFWAEHGCQWDDETINLLVSDVDIMQMLNNAIQNSNSFSELIVNLRKGEYMPYAADVIPLEYDDEDL